MPTKVARLLEERELEELGAELERRWLGEGVERESLRDLARRFNVRLLRDHMRESGLAPLEGEAANTYRLLTDDEVSAGMRVQAERELERAGIDVSDRLLTDDEVSAGMRVQAERELERAGIDVSELRTDFVSHQAIHTYLRSERDLEGPDSGTTDEDRLQRDGAAVQRLSNRLIAVAEDTIDRHQQAGTLADTTTSVLVDVTVLCEECGQQYDIGPYLQTGGCDCAE